MASQVQETPKVIKPELPELTVSEISFEIKRFVETTFNSADIINMYPLVTSEVFDKKDLCYIVNKLDENYYNEGTKVPTGLERFNRKYGIKK